MQFLSFIFLLTLAGCGARTAGQPAVGNTPTPQPERGQLTWDQSTRRRVSTGIGIRYSGYARMMEMRDKTLLAVYEADGSVVAVRSEDVGKTWSEPVTVAGRQNGINMAVPDLLPLADGSVLVAYNPRPYQIDPSRRFGIRTKKSYDNGLTWRDERLLYEAGDTFENGCWEPSAVQLPSGEVQLFFANEGVYPNSNEQNISLLRSADGGLTWSREPQMVSFRAGSRDGMPVPMLLNKGRDIVFAIEDNGYHNFKPYIIHSTVAQNWLQPVLANSADRWNALASPLPDSLYAGAPYLRQLPTGETLLSYQGTEGRINKINHAEMKVVVGDANARNFGKKSIPFGIPPDKSGLWNSLTVLADGTLIALTSTNAFTTDGRVEVWMVKGRLTH